MKTFRIGKKEILIMSKEEKLEIMHDICKIKACMGTVADIIECSKRNITNDDHVYKFEKADIGWASESLTEHRNVCDILLHKL